MINQRDTSSKKSTQVEESKNLPEFKEAVLKTWDANFSSYPESEKPYCLDDKILTKFLIARDHKIPQALTMWKNWVEWRSTTEPHKITPQEVSNELALRKFFWVGEDRYGHPLSMVKIVRTNVDADPKEVVRFGIYNLEKGIKEAEKRGQSKITCLVDFKGFSRKLMGSKVTNTMKELLTLIQSYYPERLHKLYLVNANWLFRLLYTILKPFIDKKTRDKLVIVSNYEELKKDFTPENILKEYGGTAVEPDLPISEAETDYQSKESQDSPNKYKNIILHTEGDMESKKKAESADKLGMNPLKVEIMRIKTENTLSPFIDLLVAEEKITQLRAPYGNLVMRNPFSTPR